MKLIFSETSLIKFKKNKLNWHLIGTLLKHSLTHTCTHVQEPKKFVLCISQICPSSEDNPKHWSVQQQPGTEGQSNLFLYVFMFGSFMGKFHVSTWRTCKLHTARFRRYLTWALTELGRTCLPVSTVPHAGYINPGLSYCEVAGQALCYCATLLTNKWLSKALLLKKLSF